MRWLTIKRRQSRANIYLNGWGIHCRGVIQVLRWPKFLKVLWEERETCANYALLFERNRLKCLGDTVGKTDSQPYSFLDAGEMASWEDQGQRNSQFYHDQEVLTSTSYFLSKCFQSWSHSISVCVVLFSHLPFREVVRCSGEFIMSYVLHMVFHLVFTMYEVAFLFLFHRWGSQEDLETFSISHSW